MSEFDKILKSKLDNYTESPSTEVFQNIRNNYPAKSFVEFVSYNKYYFIAGISAVIIAGILLITLPEKSEKSTQLVQPEINIVDNTNNDIVKGDDNLNIENNYVNERPNGLFNEDDKIVETTNSLKETICFDIFKSTDTIVCGNEFEVFLKGSSSNIIIPEGLKMSVKDEDVNFVCSQPGKYKIIYTESMPEKVLTDTISVFFNNVNSPNVKLSGDVLCPGEELILTISNNTSTPQWENNNYQIQKSKAGVYNISKLQSGKNFISFAIGDNNCVTKYEKTIEVLPEIAYSLVSSSAVCSQANATLIIKTDNLTHDSYVLNNQMFSESGRFDNLNAGIYCLTINYGNHCQLRDTLLIRDSLNINPYFISERDLVVKNKYYFRNLTKIDDKGYERNTAVQFLWKVNGTEFNSGDNAEYEFKAEGNNLVELIAILNETCQSVYSETVFISNSNFRIPNIFTPNGDGIGDEFKVIYDGELASYQISIINRLGEVVFESEKINHSWDGKINGNDDASEGLYYYIIRGEDKSRNKIEQKGSLQLVRY